MTCTHAAIKRRDLIALGFQYDTLVVEEAAQIMEVETFVPMVLQSADAATNRSRLKRIVLIGDHHQVACQGSTLGALQPETLQPCSAVTNFPLWPRCCY